MSSPIGNTIRLPLKPRRGNQATPVGPPRVNPVPDRGVAARASTTRRQGPADLGSGSATPMCASWPQLPMAIRTQPPTRTASRAGGGLGSRHDGGSGLRTSNARNRCANPTLRPQRREGLRSRLAQSRDSTGMLPDESLSALVRLQAGVHEAQAATERRLVELAGQRGMSLREARAEFVELRAQAPQGRQRRANADELRDLGGDADRPGDPLRDRHHARTAPVACSGSAGPAVAAGHRPHPVLPPWVQRVLQQGRVPRPRRHDRRGHRHAESLDHRCRMRPSTAHGRGRRRPGRPPSPLPLPLPLPPPLSPLSPSRSSLPFLPPLFPLAPPAVVASAARCVRPAVPTAASPTRPAVRHHLSQPDGSPAT